MSNQDTGVTLPEGIDEDSELGVEFEIDDGWASILVRLGQAEIDLHVRPGGAEHLQWLISALPGVISAINDHVEATRG